MAEFSNPIETSLFNRFGGKKAKGGLTKGKSHDEGGIPMKVKSTGQMVELEGGEGVINKYVMSDDTTFEFEGGEMTACEIASLLNQSKGDGVAYECEDVEGKFEKGGKVKMKLIDPKKAKKIIDDGGVYGRKLTDAQRRFMYASMNQKKFNLGGLVRDAEKSGFTYNNIIESVLEEEKNYENEAIGFYFKFIESVFYQQYGRFLEGKTRFYGSKQLPYGRIQFMQFVATWDVNDGSDLKEYLTTTIQDVDEKNTPRLNSKDDFKSKSNMRKFIKRMEIVFLELYQKNQKVLEEYPQAKLCQVLVRVRSEKGYRTRTYRNLDDFCYPIINVLGDDKTLDCFNLNRIYQYNTSFTDAPPRTIQVLEEFFNKNSSLGIKIPSNLTLEDANTLLRVLSNERKLEVRHNNSQFNENSFYNDRERYNYIGVSQLPPFTFTYARSTTALTTIKINLHNTPLRFSRADYDEIKSQGNAEKVKQWAKTIYSTFFSQSSLIFNLISDGKYTDEMITKNTEEQFITFVHFIYLKSVEASKNNSNLDDYYYFVQELSQLAFLNGQKITNTTRNELLQSEGLFNNDVNYDTSEYELVLRIPYILCFEGEISEEEQQKRQEAKDLNELKSEARENIGFKRMGNVVADQDVLNLNIKDELTLLKSLQLPKDSLYQKLILAEIRKKTNTIVDAEILSNSNLPLNLLEYYFNQTTQSPVAPLQEPCGLPTPNGGKSKLPLQTYFDVRSPMFKQFFGDWEKAYESGDYYDCSQIIDEETKEPKIMYHAVRRKVAGVKIANMGEGVDRPYGEFNPPKFPSSYFGDDLEYVKFYGGMANNMPKPKLANGEYEGFVYKVFINMRKPIDLRPLGFKTEYQTLLDYLLVEYGVKAEKNKAFEELLKSKGEKQMKAWVLIRNNPNILLAIKNMGYDGLIQEGDVPTYDKDGNMTKKPLIGTEYLTMYSNQVESAVTNNNLYLSVFDDIRFKRGGYVSI